MNVKRYICGIAVIISVAMAAALPVFAENKGEISVNSVFVSDINETKELTSLIDEPNARVRLELIRNDNNIEPSIPCLAIIALYDGNTLVDTRVMEQKMLHANAPEIYIDNDFNKVTVSGKSGSSFQKGVTLICKNKQSGNVIYVNQTDSDANGNYSFSFNVAETPAKYSLNIGSYMFNQAYKAEFDFPTAQQPLRNMITVTSDFNLEDYGAMYDPHFKAFAWNHIEGIIPFASATSKFPVQIPTPPIARTIKVLSLGNSFSQSATKYINQIGAAAGINIRAVNLFIAGCNLQMHWDNAKNDAYKYSLQINGNGTGDGKLRSIKQMLESDDWDYVTLQQGSNYSGVDSTYYPYIENLAKYIKELEPNAELIIHQTWAYEKGSGHSSFPTYDSDQTKMYNQLKSCYDKAAMRVGLLTLTDGTSVSPNQSPLRIIPSGTAFKNAGENPIFDTTTKDGKEIRLFSSDGAHADTVYGRYLLGAVWYEVLTGNKIADNPYVPTGLEKNLSCLGILKKAASDATAQY